MAHVERRGKNRWRARYRGTDGRERSKTFQRRIDADRFLVSIESDKLHGAWVDPRLGKMTFESWATRWMATTSHLKPKTRVGYESLLRTLLLPRFTHMPLARMQPIDVQEWIAELIARGLSPSRIRQSYYLLRAILRSAVESGYIVKTACIGVDLPRITYREMQFLSAEQVNRLADAMPEPYDALVLVLAYGGLRWGEAGALRRGRCQLLRSQMYVMESLSEVSGELYFGPTKTYANRVIVLPPFLNNLLASHLASGVEDSPEALLFTGTNGQPLRHAAFHKRFWRRAVNDAGLPQRLRIHDLRHTCAALLIAEGAHPKAIQMHLGHSSITVTLDRYGHLFPENMEHLAQGLEATYQRAVAASPRPEQTLDQTFSQLIAI